MVNHLSNMAEDFRHALRGFAATVNIISTRSAFRNVGMTATAVTSVSMDPPSLLVVVNERTSMHDTLCRNQYFCVNILGCDQAGQSRAFGGGGTMDERFEMGDWRLNGNDVPYLADAQANLFCERVDTHKFGTHSIVIGRVYQLAIGQKLAPLLYLNGKYISTDQLSRVD